ncbi:MAG: UDP-glucose 4-epimerase GalE [Oscillospiraceae bacterium]|jgi:UDP-glucose 4-epimerase|nr:UDP-glucose 4-epimerase GalE [Oscillospiraceae bacterium]
MTVLVTGGAGYIGSHTCLELLGQGYDAVVADNFSNSSPEAVRRMKELSGRDFAFYETDVRDAEKIDEIFRNHDIGCVIHFAGLKAVGESVRIPLAYYANNLESTIALCGAMKRHGVKNLIFSSSATVYSGDNGMPLTESSQTGNCINPYGWTKYMCEQILRDTAFAEEDWSVVLLRYFNPIGAHPSGLIGEDPADIPNNLMPYIAQTAVGRRDYLRVFGDDYPTPDGTGVRDYIHVTDLAKGHVAAIQYCREHAGCEAFNLGTGKGTSVLELLKAFERAAGKTIPFKVTERRPGDLPVCYASTGKAAGVLGWRAEKTVADACADSWHWQSQNPNGFNNQP